MGKKLVVAMSTSCLDYHPEPHNVRILRLNISLDGKTYIDGDTLKADDFQQWMIQSPQSLATTSPPSRLDLTKFFLRIADEGYDEVLFIAMSTALSKTYYKVQEIIPTVRSCLTIHLFDSKTATFTEGFMALEADRCLSQGMTMAQTLNHLYQMRMNNIVMMGVSNLYYLIQNGRLSSASGFIANMLQIKPLVQINEDGQIIVAEKIMTTRRAMQNLSDRIAELPSKEQSMIYTLYSGSPELHRDFTEMLAERNGLDNLPAYPISPVVAAHIGPYAFGFGAFWH